MSKTIIVSNRLPLKLQMEGDSITATPSVGGLATGMRSVHTGDESIWVGWTGLTSEEIESEEQRDAIQNKCREEGCVNVELTEDELVNYYYGFSNRTMWPILHYFIEYTEYKNRFWEGYKNVNQKFADAIIENAERNDTIWVHDYQLMLVPQMIRKERPDVRIGYFLHIPFPSFEIFRTLPYRESLLEGVLGADLIGFHTYDYERHFLSSINRIVGAEVSFNEVVWDGRNIHVDTFPMGIDYKKFHNTAKNHVEQKESESDVKSNFLMKTHKDKKIVLSIDRLDYTKGIANRLRGFYNFLEKYQDYHGKVELIMLAVPSRTDVPQYQLLKKEIDELVGRLNGKFASAEWTPVHYFYRTLPFENLIDLYTSSDIALITPIRDGMNLVAKEFIASRVDQSGVLILSEMAGAAAELTEALNINPNSYDQIADTLKVALEMSEEEQVHRNKLMQERLERYDVAKWANDFMDMLRDDTRYSKAGDAEKFEKVEEEMVTAFAKADKRILFLDYDGTLVGFSDRPEDAKPNTKLKQLILKLLDQHNTEVVLVSGRDRQSLGEWWKNISVPIIAEHGVWSKDAGKTDFELNASANKEWMEYIRPRLQSFTDRTPGTFIEEKNYSLAWHYRQSDPVLGERRANELANVIKDISANHDINVLNGNKVLEVKNSGINKGKAIVDYMDNRSYDFILAIGDDWTDEFMFRELDDEAYTIKVGKRRTDARFMISGVQAVHDLLERLGKVDL